MQGEQGMSGFTREEISFNSDGVLCRGWFYHPEAHVLERHPCIIMAHGLGGTIESSLTPYADCFARAGFCVLLFDYRYLGSSDGQPRQWISVKKQLEDWQEAVHFARRLRQVNPAKIALWGSSFSGGHVLMTAAQDQRIAAIAAQCPMMDGLAASLNVLKYAGAPALARLTALGLMDELYSLAGRQPIYVPLVAPPGQLAAMSSPDAEPGYKKLTPGHWRNEMTARLIPVFSTYRPIRHAHKVHCPVLLQVCSKDSVAPADAAYKTAELIQGPVQVKTYDMGHFDIYIDQGFQQSSQDQLQFYQKIFRM